MADKRRAANSRLDYAASVTPKWIKMFPDGQLILAEYEPHKLHLHNSNGEHILTLKYDDRARFDHVVISPDNKWFLALDNKTNTVTRHWIGPESKLATKYTPEDKIINAMDLSADGKVLVVGFDNGMASARNPATLRFVTGYAVPDEYDVFTAMRFIGNDYKTLALGTRLGKLHLWNVKSQRRVVIFSLSAEKGAVTQIESNQDGSRLLYVTSENYVAVVNAETGEVLHSKSFGEKAVKNIAFLGDEVFLVHLERKSKTSLQRSVFVQNYVTDTIHLINTIQDDIIGVSVASQNFRVATLNGQGVVDVWEGSEYEDKILASA
jgi:WD40 repeat protein